MSATAPDRAAGRPDQGLTAYLGAWWQRVRSGDLGSLPIVVGILAIVVVFGILVVVLIFRPTGILGSAQSERA